jgi:hypothetical protein
MKKSIIYIFSFFFLSLAFAFAKNSFVQLPTPVDGVRFINHSPNGSVYIRENGISLVAKRFVGEGKHKNIKSTSPNRYEVHRIDLDFVGSNSHCQFLTPKLSSDNEFIFLAGVRHELYSAPEVIIKNIYDGIDFRAYFNANDEFEFDFVVSPNADPNQIVLESNYQKNISISEDKSLDLDFMFTSARLQKPFTYQINEQSEKQEIQSQFGLSGDIITFQVNSYDKSKPLIIDPIARIMGSYYGGSSNDTGYDIAEDGQGNYFITGFTESLTDIAQAGYQMQNGGLEDAYIAKFSSNHQRLWGTYFGGYAYEVGYSIDVDQDGNVILVGETSSDTNIATPTAHQMIYGGGSADGFIAKFTTSGQLLWATYYGGSGEDKLNDVVTDQFGNIYVVGFTQSDDNIAYNGYQMLRGGQYDAFVVKLNPLGIVQWATYYGGEYDDFGNGITLDQDRTVYFVGSTESLDGIAYLGNYSSLQGQKDAFVSCFENDGTIRWGTYYGGSNDDIGTAIAAIGHYIYFAGNTKSNRDIAFNGFKNNINGEWDGFLVKYDYIQQGYWGTYYGGMTNDFIYRLAVSSPNIYVAGYTNSMSGLELAGWQQSYGGGTFDGALAKFIDNGLMEWSSYYGGTGRDELRSVSNLSKLLVVGFTNSSNNIAQNGYDNTYSLQLDAMFGEMSESELHLNLQDEQFCSGKTYTANISFSKLTFLPGNEFIVELSDEFGSFKNGTEVGRISSIDATDIELKLPVLYEYSKKYKLKMHSTIPEYYGTISLDSLTIYPKPTIINTPGPLCLGSIRMFSTKEVPDVSYEWVFEGGTVIDSTNSIRYVKWDSAGDYAIKLIAYSPICSDTSTGTIHVKALPDAQITGANDVCGFSIVEYSVANIDSCKYTWEVENGVVYKKMDNGNALIQWNNISGKGEITLTVQDTVTGCLAKNRLEVNINTTPRAIVSGADTSCKTCIESYFANDGWETEWLVSNATILDSVDLEITIQSLPDADSLIIRLVKRNPSTGCADTNTKVVYLTDSPITSISGKRTVCEFEEYEYLTSSNPDLLNSWTADGGEIISQNANKAVVRWLAHGQGSLSLLQKSKDNKYKDSAQIAVTINPKPIGLEYTLPSEICQGDTVTLMFTVKANEQVQISVDGKTYTNNEKCVFTKAGLQSVHVEVSNEFGCTVAEDISLNVKATPTAPTLTQDGSTIHSDKNGIHRWFLNGKVITGKEEATLEPTEKGIYTAQYLLDGCWSDTSNAINYTKSDVAGLLDLGILIYPNPAADRLIIKSEFLISQFEIVDLLGKSVFLGHNIVNRELDISNLNSGIYFVKMWVNDKLQTKKIIVK